MIDLHLHLDGSLSVDFVWEEMIRQELDLGIRTKEELEHRLTCPEPCLSLNQYLTCFDLPLKVLQKKDAITRSLMYLRKELEEEALLYAEIRFAPQLHRSEGLSQEEVVLAAIEGISKGATTEGLKTNLILCCMRGDANYEANRETIALADRYKQAGVVAVDLAGAEAVYPTQSFKDLFSYARGLGLNITIHAGEAAGPESIYHALAFGAKRIGHGIQARYDQALMEELKNREIYLETCPTSNVQTKAVKSIEDHPLVEFMKRGLLVTINTDNRRVSNTNLSKEIEVIRKQFGLSKKEEKQLYLTAAEAAFLSKEEKEDLVRVISQII